MAFTIIFTMQGNMYVIKFFFSSVNAVHITSVQFGVIVAHVSRLGAPVLCTFCPGTILNRAGSLPV